MDSITATTLPHVTILLSTFNGATYLAEQLESLTSQNYPNYSIVIRDDGSSDSTRDILRDFAKNNRNVVLHEGKNIGVVRSFFWLLENSDADLYSFCDQDDVWRPDKLARAVDLLVKQEDPSACMYCSRLTFTDSVGQELFQSKVPRLIGLRNAIVENIATGCTMVIGSQIKDLALHADPARLHMHDWWIYLVASTFGTVVFDPEATVYYRRHDATVTSLGRSKRTMRTRLRGLGQFLLGERRLPGLHQALVFFETYGCLLNSAEKDIFDYVARALSRKALGERIKSALFCPIQFNDPLDGLAIRLIIFNGRF